ncbi:hypothetical protein [Actinophytocola oryzae]|uniref:Uncharacterized protein n=1 Tax=Actinophytocola oryzae TaxID=502181 RepID=A0A4R7VWD9_9PSEU|nr:hypothetical protein [Actinophytocola oryzae]TDV54212.1 hypothetical protein CLV71_104683 [Actinophytocola oryzae]
MVEFGGRTATEVDVWRIDGLIAQPRTPWDGVPATTVLPSPLDYSDQPRLLGRLKPGRALESRRVVHVFLLEACPNDTFLTAQCGETLRVRDLDWLPRLGGMPCEQCVMRH